MKFKILSLLTALAMVLCSCGIITINNGSGNDENPDDTSAEKYETSYYETYPVTDGEAVSKSRLDALGYHDFNGKSVFIVNCNEAGDIFNDESGMYSSAIYKRNKMVSEKYNCRIVTQQKDQRTAYKEAVSADQSGVYYADIAVIPAERLGKWYVGSHVRNLTAISHLNLSAEYYQTATSEQLSTASSVFGVVGDAVKDIRSSYCIYVNKTLLASTGQALDYGMVKSGGFTWEKLLEMSRAAEDGIAGITTDVDDQTLTQIGMMSSGQNYLTRQDGEGFSLSCETEQSKSLVGYLKDFIEGKTEELTVTETVNTEDGQESEVTGTYSGFELFTKGVSLFSLATVGEMSQLENCGFSFEVLPLPKLTPEQNGYATALSGGTPVMTVLTNTSDIDKIGYIFEGLNAASSGLEYEFYKIAMRDYITGVYTPDMLDLIAENPMYDFASMFALASDSILNGTVVAFYNAVKGDKELENYFKKPKKALNNYLKELE